MKSVLLIKDLDLEFAGPLPHKWFFAEPREKLLKWSQKLPENPLDQIGVFLTPLTAGYLKSSAKDK